MNLSAFFSAISKFCLIFSRCFGRATKDRSRAYEINKQVYYNYFSVAFYISVRIKFCFFFSISCDEREQFSCECFARNYFHFKTFIFSVFVSFFRYSICWSYLEYFHNIQTNRYNYCFLFIIY